MHVNPTGRFVTGGPMGDAGPDRPQDHRRQLRRDGPPRRRRLLGQGSDQGRPLGGLRRPLGGQERRRGRARRPLRGRGRLRHRDRPADQLQRRVVRHRAHRRRRRSRRSSSATSTCDRPRSSRRSTCAGRSTARPRRTATSVGRTWTCPGNGPTRRRCSPPTRACPSPRPSGPPPGSSASGDDRRHPVAASADPTGLPGQRELADEQHQQREPEHQRRDGVGLGRHAALHLAEDEQRQRR